MHNKHAHDQSDIHLNFLQDVFNSDAQVIKKVVDMLIQDFPRRSNIMRSAYRNKAWKELFLQAHSIIPSAKYLGATYLESDLRAIMLYSNQKKETREFSKLLEYVTQKLHALSRELSQLKKKL